MEIKRRKIIRLKQEQSKYYGINFNVVFWLFSAYSDSIQVLDRAMGKGRVFSSMEYNLIEGSITGKLLKFAFPLMIGNLLQQCYNIADTLIVGRFLGADALAAVGSA